MMAYYIEKPYMLHKETNVCTDDTYFHCDIRSFPLMSCAIGKSYVILRVYSENA